RIGSIGFSTHAPTDVICRAVLTNRFDFVNLHYYYFWQRNLAALQLAQSLDMGVFIISPNDKGGHLFNPPPLLKRLTAPLPPISDREYWFFDPCANRRDLPGGTHESLRFCQSTLLLLLAKELGSAAVGSIAGYGRLYHFTQ